MQKTTMAADNKALNELLNEMIDLFFDIENIKYFYREKIAKVITLSEGILNTLEKEPSASDKKADINNEESVISDDIFNEYFELAGIEKEVENNKLRGRRVDMSDKFDKKLLGKNVFINSGLYPEDSCVGEVVEILPATIPVSEDKIKRYFKNKGEQSSSDSERLVIKSEAGKYHIFSNNLKFKEMVFVI